MCIVATPQRPASSAPLLKGKRKNAEDFLEDSDDGSESESVLTSCASNLDSASALGMISLDVCDELSLYLLEKDCKMSYIGPDGQRHQFDLLEWWKGHETKYPNLARMAKQYLSMPATSAGVERLFSKAGKQYDNLSHNKSAESLQHSLMASTNYVPKPCKYGPIKGGKS